MRRVLIADDEAIERKYLKSLFEKHRERYQVAGEAAGGREAVEMALAQRPDVLILDINMPGMSGLEAAAEIRKKLPGAVILLNTAYAEFEFAQKAVEYHLDAYLLKPSAEEVLLETIENCFATRARAAQGNGGEEDPPAGPITRPVAEYIQRNFSETLSLKELADFAHFSPSYLSHLFHAEHGLTIKAYISRQRIARAEELLRESGLSVKEICARCGFANISHFNRVFKQTTGRAPGEYRKEG